MRSLCITPSKLQGTITIPSSKSHTLRALLFASLAHGKTIIHQPLRAHDTDAMIQAVRSLGADVETFSDRLEIEGIGKALIQTKNVIDAKNSGIVLRFCSAVGALSPFPVVVTGDYFLRHQRSMKELIKAVSQLGVHAVSMQEDGYAPILLQGPLQPGKTFFSGEDSQPVSALLIASSFVDGQTELHIENPGEQPWITVTLNWLDRLGIEYTNDTFHRYTIYGGADYEGFSYCVPGDLSSLAFPIAAALITRSEITIQNVDLSDCQGDKEFVFLVQSMGASLDIDATTKSLHVQGKTELTGRSIDLNTCIDTITIFAVLGCFAEGETHLYNAAIAKQKECNRITAIAEELRKMGADIQVLEDGLLIKKSPLLGASLHSHHDHRMAMSLAVAALGASGDSRIDEVGCIAKTFPRFVSAFQQIGAIMKEST